MLGQIERYIKQAIVDKNSMVASAALVSAMHFAKVLILIFVGCCLLFVPPIYTLNLQESPEIVRRWYNEITAAISPPAEMVQYHALSLLLDLRKGDQMAISKVCIIIYIYIYIAAAIGGCRNNASDFVFRTCMCRLSPSRYRRGHFESRRSRNVS